MTVYEVGVDVVLRKRVFSTIEARDVEEAAHVVKEEVAKNDFHEMFELGKVDFAVKDLLGISSYDVRVLAIEVTPK